MKTNLITILIISLIMVSCKSNQEDTDINNSEFIEITKAQFESEKMVIGEPLLHPFSNIVHFTGSILPSVDGQAQVSLALPGQINKIYYKPGQYISKGSVLFEVTGNAFIDLQKDFAESSAIIARLKSDYNRAKELYNENIVTQKDFTFAESSYLSEYANYNALKIIEVII